MADPVFEKVAPVADFPALEAKVREFWQREQIFRKSVAQRAGGPRFVFYEGPPTANGLPHNGHALTRVMKDVFPRYRSMRGFDVLRKGGWDTHGLPVEIEVEKELRISGRQAILDYGVEPFVRRCLDSVFRYTEEWNSFSEKIAFWVDLDDAYVTYHQSYVESVWWALSELHRKGYLFRGHKVVWWWAQGGTVLSAAEVGEGYKTVDDPSVYVRFPLADEPDTALLVWTTTPWTLPSNQFAAVGAEIEYAVVRDGDKKLIVASALRESLAEKVGRELPVERTLRGAELIGRRYAPPFDWFAGATGAEWIRQQGAAAASGADPRAGLWRVVAADFVELGAGTGIVHIAPAFGESDFEVLRAEQARDPSLPLLCAVRPDGGFDPGIAPEQYAGRWVKDCDRDLRRELEARDLCWHAETIRHEYPFCVRSDEDPLIQYARPAWYIGTRAHKERALANNAAIEWLPEHIRDGRFGDFLRNNVDWALSRERFWGTPLNLWINDQTGAIDAPASVTEILARNPRAFDAFDAALAKDPTLSPHLRVHKPWIDEVTWTKPGEPGVYRRVPEVIDVWFDAGSMPFAQWGYPHAGKAEFEANFPADFISEAIDQTRGWFHALLWVSTLLFEEQTLPHPYRRCIVLGHVADRHGKKESKSKGNYTPPEVILDRVRLEFAVVEADAKDAPVPGTARIAREDYEGLDLHGESARVRIARGDRPGDSREVELRPAKLPRRVIELAAPELAALGLSAAPRGAQILPREVPGLAPAAKLWVEDPASSAPGADAFRWFFFASNPPWNPTRHSLAGVRAQQRELPLTLRNVYSFFCIYANIDGFDPAQPQIRAGRRAPRERALLDRWILSELARTNAEVIERLDAYRVYEATRVLSDFVDALSNWYLRRSRDRFWAEGLGPDKLDAHWTLYECLVALAGLLAPFLPYAAEEIWQNLVRRPLGAGAASASSAPEVSSSTRSGSTAASGAAAQSVHLSDYPQPDASALDAELSRTMNAVRALVSLGLQVRTSEKLRVRQPLAAAEIVLSDPELEPALRAHEALIREELNVHEVRFAKSADELVRYEVKPNFRALGPKVGKQMPAVKAALAAADGAALLRSRDADGRVALEISGERLRFEADEIAVSLHAREGFAAAAGDTGVVVLHTQLTPELIEEGWYREVLNRIQNFRKELDLDYAQRITLHLDGDADLLRAIAPRLETLQRETLATRVHFGSPPIVSRYENSGHELSMAAISLGLPRPRADESHRSEARIDGRSLRIALSLA